MKITPDHLLLCVFLRLVLGATDSSSSTPHTEQTELSETTTKTKTSPPEATTATLVDTPLSTQSATKPPPDNVQTVNVPSQNDHSITLVWDKVENIPTYVLQYHHESDFKEEPVTASDEETSVTYMVSPLTAGRKYNFTLITVLGDVNSTGYSFEAVTAPLNAEEFKSIEQSENSITLQWKKVDGFPKYVIMYNDQVINVTASEEAMGTELVSGLTSGTEYNFTLFTVFEHAKSSGVSHSAVTAPENVQTVNVSSQNDHSITLVWDKVENIPTYVLQYHHESDFKEEPITASDEETSVTYMVSPLTAGRKYNFTLITVLGDVNSTGYTFEAVTAPLNAEEFKSIEQSTDSITLQWKKVDGFSKYVIMYNDQVIDVTASEEPMGTQLVSGLTSGTEYNFTLFTVFEHAKSSGVSHSALSAPENVQTVNVSSQNDHSITLVWDKVKNISTYVLQYHNESIFTEEPITASDEETSVTHLVSPLTAGRKYNFTLITVFGDVNSTGYSFEAVTAPRNAEEFESVGRSETGITLQWKKVDGLAEYVIMYNDQVINVTTSEGPMGTQLVSGLTSGTEYNFTLFTVFERAKSSGVSHSAVTAPLNAEEFESIARNETSITLQWAIVDGFPEYVIMYNEEEINVTSSKGPMGTQLVSGLKSGTEYHFTLFTVFKGVRSSGANHSTVTVPPKVDDVKVTRNSVTNITLKWGVGNKKWIYLVQMNGEDVYLQPTGPDMFVSHMFSNLRPGTEYSFSVTTMFSGFNSTTYIGVTVTGIDCASGTWHVTNSSILGKVNGLFMFATATNSSQPQYISEGGDNVSFTGLYPGATYEVSLEYKRNNIKQRQCSHNLTILPPDLTAGCAYYAAGYSVLIHWEKPAGILTAVEVNVTGETHTIPDTAQEIKLSGFQPARTYEVSVAALSGDRRSAGKYVFSCLADPRGVIAGSVFAVLLFGFLVCLILFILLKRPNIIRRKTSLNGHSKGSKEKYTTISVAKFPDHFHQLSMDENRGFSQEYESLLHVGTEQTRKEATLPENKPRNRFNNVLPYDWCRVKLSSSNPDETPDYINASYMAGYKNNREYIATQGPLPSTVNDFWRMIWEQRVKGIVMVTNCTEGGRTKCEQYWPADSEPHLYGDLLITMTSEKQETNWTLREFCIKNDCTSEQRTVKHFHFTAWPDHGVPQGTEVLIQFRGLVRQHIERDGGGAPTVVHCSAGVGRTGTIIALDVLLQELERDKAVGIRGFVHKMRLRRPHMVQTESQYIFLHHCIMDSLNSGLQQNKTDENIYENADMIYVNATALQQLNANT